MMNVRKERITHEHVKWNINKRRRTGESTKQAAKRLATGEGPFFEEMAKEWLNNKGVEK